MVSVYKIYILRIQNILINDTSENHIQLSENIKYLALRKAWAMSSINYQC